MGLADRITLRSFKGRADLHLLLTYFESFSLASTTIPPAPRDAHLWLDFLERKTRPRRGDLLARVSQHNVAELCPKPRTTHFLPTRKGLETKPGQASKCGFCEKLQSHLASQAQMRRKEQGPALLVGACLFVEKGWWRLGCGPESRGLA